MEVVGTRKNERARGRHAPVFSCAHYFHYLYFNGLLVVINKNEIKKVVSQLGDFVRCVSLGLNISALADKFIIFETSKPKIDFKLILNLEEAGGGFLPRNGAIDSKI